MRLQDLVDGVVGDRPQHPIEVVDCSYKPTRTPKTFPLDMPEGHLPQTRQSDE